MLHDYLQLAASGQEAFNQLDQNIAHGLAAHNRSGVSANTSVLPGRPSLPETT